MMKYLLHVTVVVSLFVGISPTTLAQYEDPLPPPYTERDVIHPKIDVHAQRAIVRLSHGDARQRSVIRYLRRGIDAGLLGGIYIVNQQVPAMRANRLGKGWWTLLQGRPATCWKEPVNEPPLIIFSEKIANQPQILDNALVAAFEQCGFREVHVKVMQSVSGALIPCGEATVMPFNTAMEIRYDPPCNTTQSGTCRFALPPAPYAFRVTCRGASTVPPDILRNVVPGAGVQVEWFNF